MRTRIALDVDDLDRYLIARYFATAESEKPRNRATRAQVRRYAVAAINAALRDASDAARGRTKSTVRRMLAKGEQPRLLLDETQMLRLVEGRQPTLW